MRVLGSALLAGLFFTTPVLAETVMHNAVGELFTSQGCSSCPAADSLLRQMSAADPDILMLSFHVTYWDSFGWRDPYSLPEATQRQGIYAHGFGDKQVYTPELIVNGGSGIIANDEIKVKEALETAQHMIPLFDIEVAPHSRGLEVRLHPENNFAATRVIEVWQISYVPIAHTQVKGGANDGRMLDSIDNVSFVKKLSAGADGAYALDAKGMKRGKTAILVQGAGQGRIFAAATYEK